MVTKQILVFIGSSLVFGGKLLDKFCSGILFLRSWMITATFYFNDTWFGFTGVDIQPQVMSPRAISSRLKEVVHKGLLPRVLLLSQLHFTCKRRWLIFPKAIRTAIILCLLHFVLRHFFSRFAFTIFHVTCRTNLVYELCKLCIAWRCLSLLRIFV